MHCLPLLKCKLPKANKRPWLTKCVARWHISRTKAIWPYNRKRHYFSGTVFDERTCITVQTDIRPPWNEYRLMRPDSRYLANAGFAIRNAAWKLDLCEVESWHPSDLQSNCDYDLYNVFILQSILNIIGSTDESMQNKNPLHWPQPSGSLHAQFKRAAIATDHGLCSEIGRFIFALICLWKYCKAQWNKSIQKLPIIVLSMPYLSMFINASSHYSLVSSVSG